MQDKKRPKQSTRGGKFDNLKPPAHQLPSVNVCVEQVVRAFVALELWVPDFRNPVRSLWDELQDTDAIVDLVHVAQVQVRGKDDAVLRLHPRQVTFCALHGVRAREVLAYLCEMKEQTPDEPERPCLTFIKAPRTPDQLNAYCSIAAVYAAVQAVLGLDKGLQHGTH